MEIEPLRTMLKRASPGSASELHNGNTNQYRALFWLYYDQENYDNYTDAERIQLWTLGTFYYNTLGHQWRNSKHWMTNATVCEWYGLTCDEETNTWVTEISLPNNRVRRDLPNEFTLLTRLRYLGLADNYLGRLDPMLFEMAGLEVIDFDNNGIREIPPNIPRTNRLKELYLAQNRIEVIPSSMVMLQKLEVLWLWENSLEGTLPSILASMSRLGSHRRQRREERRRRPRSSRMFVAIADALRPQCSEIEKDHHPITSSSHPRARPAVTLIASSLNPTAISSSAVLQTVTHRGSTERVQSPLTRPCLLRERERESARSRRTPLLPALE